DDVVSGQALNRLSVLSTCHSGLDPESRTVMLHILDSRFCGNDGKETSGFDKLSPYRSCI
ncbi:MAG: hypothetical protein P9M15_00480, partial [Candidatus Electryoneaceae bacterium]|nr:hypothetical protein [Candidatus Electryoneaceae bacterium]